MASPQRHTLNEVHVGRLKASNSTPPCMFCRRTSHQPSSSQPKLEGHIPCSTSLMSHAQSHLTPPHQACSATAQPSKHRASPRKGGIPQQRPTLNEVHAARPKAPGSTPPCMFHHRTNHQPSSSQPKLEGNIATFHSQQGSCRTPKGTRHCLTVQVPPPHRRRQPPSSADHHPHAPSICPCVAHSAWGMGVAEDIGVPPCPAHAD